ncbi:MULTISPECIES: hypothetical protein [Aurantimonas]|uniref:hypothetical protein n=2 Tax=Aurantimonadaceae TaxID=255475 RepID=UPI003516168B
MNMPHLLLARIAILLPLLAAFAGCHQTLTSVRLQTTETVDGVPTCQTNLGAYALPRKLLRAIVRTDAGSVQPTRYALEIQTDSDANWTYVPEKRAVFCLDYLHSAFGRNAVAVDRSEAGLLESVVTKFETQTNQIAARVIDAATTLAASREASLLERGALGGRSASVDLESESDKAIASYTFDPFDYQRMVDVNQVLRDSYGYCIQFDGRNDPRIPAWHADLCPRSGGYGIGKSSGAYTETQYDAAFAEAKQFENRGIIYRPQIAHRMRVLRRLDPHDNLEPWKLVGTEHVEMPNRAPLLALAVTRGLFTTTTTKVTFVNGMLDAVDIEKPSEVNAAVDIPIYLVNAVLDIPARALTIFQNRAANRQALINANAELIKTARDLKDERLKDAAIARGLVPASVFGAPSATLDGSAVGTARNLGLVRCEEDRYILNDPRGLETCENAIAEAN